MVTLQHTIALHNVFLIIKINNFLIVENLLINYREKKVTCSNMQYPTSSSSETDAVFSSCLLLKHYFRHFDVIRQNNLKWKLASQHLPDSRHPVSLLKALIGTVAVKLFEVIMTKSWCPLDLPH